MVWRNKLEQLVGLLEKMPRPKTFKTKAGVYEPYFVLELRSSNWELVPYATYTRLDGSPGREVRLTLSVVDTSKVNITQSELDTLIFLEGDTNSNRSIFNYTQPVGFLFDWLANSTIYIKELTAPAPVKAMMYPDKAKIILRLQKGRSGYYLQPALVFENGDVKELNEPGIVLTSNPIYMLFGNRIYHITSALPAMFWHNYFRIREKFEIPHDELPEFIRIYLPHLLPVIDWENLGEHIVQLDASLTKKSIEFTEYNQHLQIDIYFHYDDLKFPAYPVIDRSLTTRGKQLCILKRNIREESEARKVLEENGLIYRNGHWSIAADYNNLDWFRLTIPRLERAGFTIVNEDQLKRYRVHRQSPKLNIKIKSSASWLDVKYHLSLGREKIVVPNLQKQLESGKPYLRLDDGSHIFITDELKQQFEAISQYLDLKNGQGEMHLPMAGITVIQELTPHIESLRIDPSAGELLEKYRQFQSIQAVTPPKNFRGHLREYQQHGLNWLYFLKEMNFGGILADDMGLGKTIQLIALLQKLKEEEWLTQPALIVVPLTLVFNWEDELKKFAPELKVLRYYGNRAERKNMLETITDYDVVLCSYGMILQDQKQLSKINFSYLVLDESQKIKNPETKTYRALEKLKAQRRLAMTGTPVENSLTDLWAQMNFVNPGLLGTQKQFEARYLAVDEAEREAHMAQLRKLIYPFILRRTKKEVETQLPPLTEIIQHVEMTENQRVAYEKWLNFYREQVMVSVDTEGLNKSRLKIVEALTYLRQIACHPAILEETTDIQDAGKIQLLEDMLEDLLIKGHKVLIFSQFVRFLKIVRNVFEKHGWTYEYLDGQVPQHQRREKINNFQNNPDISAFLISLKAGGVGLNLTAADYVIHLDPWWNPAVEQQATDRAHRIGQTKRVFVYKYIVKNTVEEYILNLQNQKRELSKSLITSDEGFIKQLTREDLELLFAQSKNGNGKI
jgi:non-specific serine/threonine protein kinase